MPFRCLRWPAWRRPRAAPARRQGGRSNHPSTDLVEFDALKQGFEIALAEALVALALDDLEEDRPDHILGEDLKQQALAFGRCAIDQDAALFEFGGRLAMILHPLVDQLVI